MAYQTSQGLASLGRNGDSVLVHMSPTEVAGLQGLAMSQGGSLTINPHTGLPEAFNLGGFFKSLLPVFAGAVTGGAGMPLWAGIAAGAATGAVTSKDKLMGAITGGLGGYGGYGLGSGLAAAGAAPGVAPVAPAGGYVPGTVEGANTALNVAGTYNPALSPATTNAVNAMNASGFAGSAGTGATGIDKSFLGGMDRIGSGVNQMGTGIKNIATGQPGAFDAFKNSFVAPGGKPLSDLAGYSKIAMPIGGAALGGLEPSDIYGEPINMDEAKKKQAYDPNATLNLSGDTGLRLYAEGGTIATGGIRDLYGSSDNQNQAPLSRDGYGLGRLNQLGNQQSLSQAQTLGYAEGGETSLNLDRLPSLNVESGKQISAVDNAYNPTSFDISNYSGYMTPNTEGSLRRAHMIKEATRADATPFDMSKYTGYMTPNTEGSLRMAHMVNNFKPEAQKAYSDFISRPKFAMGGPVSFAEGGETSLNLDRLPSLNVNTGTNSSSGLSNMGGDALYSFNDKAAFSPVARMLLPQMSQSDRAKFLGSDMGVFFGMQERPKQDYYTSSGALTSRYAMGGPVSFADGGDSNKEDALGLPSLSPDMSMDPNAGNDNSAMIQSVMGAMQPTQGNAPMTQGQMPDQSNDSLIAKVTANLRTDPNYQPTNPIEAAIVKQIKGTDPMQQGQPSLQGLGSLGPSQPMAPSYAPSVAMGPTYFAGMNAPQGYAKGGYLDGQGYAEGGETSLNLDRLPSLNVNTGEQVYAGAQPIKFSSGNSAIDTLFSSRYIPSQDNKSKVPNPLYGFTRMIDYQNNPKLRGQISMSDYINEGYAKGGYLDGQGDGMSDSIPATIEGKQPARLADGEFVIPADVVSHIGNGSSKAGSKRLYAMLDKVRKARTGHTKQGKQIKPEKYMPA